MFRQSYIFLWEYLDPKCKKWTTLKRPGKSVVTFLQINPTVCTILLSIFISLLYMFRTTMCPSSGEITVPMRHWYLSLCMGGVASGLLVGERGNKYTKQNCAHSWIYL